MKIIKKFTFLFYSILLLTFVCFPMVNKIYAEGTQLSLEVQDKGNEYSVTLEINKPPTYDYKIYLVIEINGESVKLLYDNKPQSIQKNSKPITVYASLTDVSETAELPTIYSDKITLTPTSVATTEIIPPTTTAEQTDHNLSIAVKTLLPFILLITLILVIIKKFGKVKLDSLSIIIRELESINKNTNIMLQNFKNEKISERKKLKDYRKLLKKTKRLVNFAISEAIPLNIEGLGQYNLLVSNLFVLNNVITCALLNKEATIEEQFLFIKGIRKDILSTTLKNSKDLQKTVQEQEQNTNNLFIQYSTYKDNIKNQKDYKKLFDKMKNIAQNTDNEV